MLAPAEAIDPMSSVDNADSFFPNPRECDEFALRHIAPVLFSANNGPISVRRGPFQGYQSYSTVLTATVSCERVVVQFQGSRPNRETLYYGHVERGSVISQADFWGVFSGSLVFKATHVVPRVRRHVHPNMWVPADNYIYDLEAMLTTARDIGRFCTTTIARNKNCVMKRQVWDFPTIFATAQRWAVTRVWDDMHACCIFGYCIDQVRTNLEALGELPYARFHSNPTPSNFIRSPQGNITCVGGGDKSHFQPVGSNFQCFQALLDAPLAPFKDDPGARRDVDNALYGAVRDELHNKGYDIGFKLLMASRAAGLLKYTVQEANRLGSFWTEAELTTQGMAFVDCAEHLLN